MADVESFIEDVCPLLHEIDGLEHGVGILPGRLFDVVSEGRVQALVLVGKAVEHDFVGDVTVDVFGGGMHGLQVVAKDHFLQGRALDSRAAPASSRRLDRVIERALESLGDPEN